MWARRKTPQALTSKQYQALPPLFRQAPVVQVVYDLCQALTDIFDNPAFSPQEARDEIATWIARVRQTGVRAFNTFLATLKAHWTEITNYFRNRHNSGFVEGLNTKIKVIKRRCYGMLNPQHLFQRISLDLGGYARRAEQ